MHEINCKQPYHTFADFCSSQEPTLLFQYFLKQLDHIFVESYNDEEHIFIDKIVIVIAYRILKFESMNKKPKVATHAFPTSITFNSISSFLYINSVVYSIYLPKDYDQDNLLFVCLQFYKHICLKIMEGNICFCIQVRNQQ